MMSTKHTGISGGNMLEQSAEYLQVSKHFLLLLFQIKQIKVLRNQCKQVQI